MVGANSSNLKHTFYVFTYDHSQLFSFNVQERLLQKLVWKGSENSGENVRARLESSIALVEDKIHKSLFEKKLSFGIFFYKKRRVGL